MVIASAIDHGLRDTAGQREIIRHLCSLEFVGPFERHEWTVAATRTPITYIVWSLWLITTGVFFLL